MATGTTKKLTFKERVEKAAMKPIGGDAWKKELILKIHEHITAGRTLDEATAMLYWKVGRVYHNSSDYDFDKSFEKMRDDVYSYMKDAWGYINERKFKSY